MSYQHAVKSEKIVIVGAGLAGFSTAAKLIENGHDDIVILEAENRIGGRVNSVPHQNGFIDLGAQFVHGQGKNLIYEACNKYFKFGDLGEDLYGEFVLSSGKKANAAQCEKLGTISDKIMEHSYKDMENFNGSLGDFFKVNYKKALSNRSNADLDNELKKQMLEYFEKDTNLAFASPTWSNVSARLNAQSESTSGKQYLTWKTEGFKTVFDFISKKRPDVSKHLKVESKVQLNKEVTNIDWSEEKVSVKCADGSSYKADHVIFTASLGVLKKRHATLFTPKLSVIKVRAIESIGFGTLGKVFLEFSKAFWPLDDEDWLGYSFLWTEQDKTAINGSAKEWLLDVVGFFKVESFPNTFEAILSGKNMKAFESRSDAEIIDDCMWLLEKFLGKKLPRPTEMKRTRWLTNKNFLGTYSFVSVDAERNNATENDLAETLKSAGDKPAVLFAGEATDSRFPSYTHGAIASGYRAASELIEFFD